jgi:hypothetical protein
VVDIIASRMVRARQVIPADYEPEVVPSDRLTI